jgi:hypothetical protein
MLVTLESGQLILLIKILILGCIGLFYLTPHRQCSSSAIGSPAWASSWQRWQLPTSRKAPTTFLLGSSVARRANL